MIRCEEGNMPASQDIAAKLLAHGHTPEETATETGIGVETIQHWLANHAFKEKLRDIRKQTREETSDYLHWLAHDALRELKKLMKSSSEDVRLRACVTVLENAKLIQTDKTE
jgi:hypothetical protein